MNTGTYADFSSPSSSSTPRVGSLSSSSTGHDSAASLTSYSSLGTNSPPGSRPHRHFGDYDHYQVPYDYSRTMNATQSYAPHPHHGYMDNHHAHMNNGPMPVSMPPYHHYPGAPMQQQQHQHQHQAHQPQQQQHQPQQPMGSYQQPHGYHYPYAHVVTSQPNHTQHYAQHTLPAPPIAPPPQPSSLPSHNRPMDVSGQVQPPGHRPKLTGTVWEDEGTICFQVEVNGICVARREDNHFINGTKLLNVANMTRGRRDGILKSEKLRSVIKIGPMHLKGVWIPFERALEFANKEKITEQLYPLFVENIGPLLTPHMQETLRGARMQNGQQQLLRTSSGPQTSQAPTSHHHSSSSSGQPATPLVIPTSRAGERASNFPTPPTSTSSIMGTGQNGSYSDWNTIAPASQAPLSIDTNGPGKSLPHTPTTGVSEHTMHQQYVPQYDASRPVYSGPPQHPYGATNYGQMYPVKTEMAAPARPGEDKEADAIHYAPEHGYTYNSSDPINAEARSSPHTQGSGRATPRSVATPQTQWQSNSYVTPQGRAQQSLPSSSLTYGSSVASNGYTAPTPPTTYQYTNGTGSALKRGRDDEDEDEHHPRLLGAPDAIKRRRTMPMPGSADASRVGPPLVQHQ